jgi:pyrimidine-specific ribonucleoside hydrolase
MSVTQQHNRMKLFDMKNNVEKARRRSAGVCLSVAFWLAAATTVFAHEQLTPVVLDTDMALDDVRALVLLLNAPDVSLRAIVTSDGSSSPAAGATNVLRLLKSFGREAISVGAGRTLGKPSPQWGEQSMTLGWSDLPVSTNDAAGDAVCVLTNALSTSTNPVTWICLGPMSNLADLLHRRPELKSRISRVYFYGGPPDADDAGWNTTRDLESAREVFASGLEIVSVQLADGRVPVLDTRLLDQIQNLGTPAARLIVRLHSHPNVRRLVEQGHFRAWDESVVLLFLEPQLGLLREQPSRPHIHEMESFDTDAARAAYLAELQSNDTATAPRALVTLREFPVAPELFQSDIQPLAKEIIQRHGGEEWKVVVLTSELHRHLGLYSIVGAKMGLRARELLGASLDDLRVESLAGNQPPISCFNDGLQASTGASLGRGTIRVAETTSPEAAAVFTFNGRKLTMRLRDGAIQKIQAELRQAVNQYGDLTPAYFAEVRRISLQAWLELDGKTIFNETLENVNP